MRLSPPSLRQLAAPALPGSGTPPGSWGLWGRGLVFRALLLLPSREKELPGLSNHEAKVRACLGHRQYTDGEHGTTEEQTQSPKLSPRLCHLTYCPPNPHEAGTHLKPGDVVSGNGLVPPRLLSVCSHDGPTRRAPGRCPWAVSRSACLIHCPLSPVPATSPGDRPGRQVGEDATQLGPRRAQREGAYHMPTEGICPIGVASPGPRPQGIVPV